MATRTTEVIKSTTPPESTITPVRTPAVWKRTVLALLLIVPGIGLILAAVPDVRDGLLWDASIPTPEDIEAQWPLPSASYARSASLLSKTNSRDTEAHIFAAEAAMLANGDPSQQINALQVAVSKAPANARAWMVLSDAYRPRDPKMAAKALAQALLLAPYDYFLAGPRAERAAILWDYLDDETRAAGLRQTLMLWESPELRDEIHALMASQDGIDLLNRALAHRQNELSRLKLWLRKSSGS